MKSQLFKVGKPLDKFHKFTLSYLINSCIVDFKYHDYNPTTNLVMFYNERIFGRYPFGGKIYRSIHEVIKHGLIPVIAENMVRRTKGGDLVKTQLELEINTSQYLEQGELDKAIEVLLSASITHADKELAVSINEDEQSIQNIGVVGKNTQGAIKPGDTFNIIIHDSPATQNADGRARVMTGLSRVLNMPLTIMPQGAEDD